MTLMEPPRLLALFNQPIPKLTTGRRDVTSVPDQALALLNDPFVVAMSKRWSERVLRDGCTSPEQRDCRSNGSGGAFPAAGRRRNGPPRQPGGRDRPTAGSRGREHHGLSAGLAGRVAHALFNVKEFIHVR